MAWWYIVFIIAGAVVLGLVVGYLVNKFVVRISQRSTGELRSISNVASPLVKSPPVHTPAVPDLFLEIEHNRRVASAEWKGELQLFVMRAWENRGDEVRSLPTEIRGELGEAYSDMALANSIVWLSTEMARRSPSLDESYVKLCINITERLNRIKPKLDGTIPPAQSVSSYHA